MPESILELLQQHFPHTPTPCQEKAMQAVDTFMANRSANSLFILNGYAGTGKTTFISTLVKVLSCKGIDTVLLAPTGRAAKVMSSYAGKRAHTIHRYIYWIFTSKEGGLKVSLQANKHKNTLFIVDEASMIGTSYSSSLSGKSRLLDDLIQYVQKGEMCNLMFVGDTAQLPPVGEEGNAALSPAYFEGHFNMQVASSIFYTVVRQHSNSGILHNATILREALLQQQTELPVLNTDMFEDVKGITGTDLRDVLDYAYSCHDKQNVIVLCRSNKRANLYNQQIRVRILFREDVIATGDMLMVVKNNYFCLPENHSAGFIANGDIVEIMRIRRIYQLYGFDFADVTIRMCDYPDDINFETTLLLNALDVEAPALPREETNKLFQEVLLDYEDEKSYKAKMDKMRENPHYNALQVKFAYAITTHKSQGGQWHTVFVDHGFLDAANTDALFYKWLYTSFTRATDKLYLVNFDEGFFNKV